jgi:tetratricopeptide (TPR) repeat protein
MERLKRHAIVLVIVTLTSGASWKAYSQSSPVESKSSREASSARSRELSATGERLRRKWELEPAAAAFRGALAADPTNLEASLGAARIARSWFAYDEALALLEAATKHHRRSADLLAEYGNLYLIVEEPERARDYFDRALSIDSSNAAASVGRAGADLLLRNYDKAEGRLREVVSRYPNDNRALVMLARVLLERNRNEEAGDLARRALSLDQYEVDAIYLLAFVNAADRKPAEVARLCQRALELDPLNGPVRRMLSSYVDGNTGYEQKVEESAARHYERARQLKKSGRPDEAILEFESALRTQPRYYRALIGLADIWLRKGEHERGARVARQALEIDPQGACAHLELSYAYMGLREAARRRIGATDFSTKFFSQPAVAAFELTDDIFPDYSLLTKRQQTVINRVVAPLAQFLPRLLSAGARHHLLAFDQRLSDSPEIRKVNQKKTFDGRYYASVRGIGGRVTVSGIEYLEMAASGGVNIIAHEFAHQVHITALGPDDVMLVRSLYEQALKDDRVLDFYAAADEYEYFAQGYEAYISISKRPAASVTARHTNRELLERDPQLYALFDRLARGSRDSSTAGLRGDLGRAYGHSLTAGLCVPAAQPGCRSNCCISA